MAAFFPRTLATVFALSLFAIAQGVANRGSAPRVGTWNPAPPTSQPQNAPAPDKAAAASDADQALMTFKASTQIVVVDVVVADRAGKPIRGLKPSDFRVEEDGKPQPLRDFQEITGTQAAQPAAANHPAAPSIAAGAMPAEPNVFSNRSQAKETGSSTIILLDLLNTPMENQEQAREQLIDFLKKKPEASQMALCALSQTALRLIQGFTPDPGSLIAGVNGKKGGVQAPPFENDEAVNRTADLFRDAVLGGFASKETLDRMQNVVDTEKANLIDTRMTLTLDAFAQLSRYLAGVPGRKNLVWLSGSFPLDIFPNPDVTHFTPVSRDYGPEVRRVSRLLADAHVAVYPVHVKGLTTAEPYTAADRGDTESGVATRMIPGAAAGGGGGPGPIANVADNQPMSSAMDRNMRQWSEARIAEQATMQGVAEETGGRAFYETNGLAAAIETAADEGSHYYTLAYSPANKKYDGSFRKIKVSLLEGGYRLAYRHGYWADNPYAPVKDQHGVVQDIAIAAMQHGSPQSAQVEFTARVVPVGAPRKVDAAKLGLAKPNSKAAPEQVAVQHYAIDYAVEPSDLTFWPTPDGRYHGLLNFMVTAFDDNERTVARLESTAASDLKQKNYRAVLSAGFRLRQEFDVPANAVALRLGVEDRATSHIGTMEISLPVAAPSAAVRARP